MMGLFDELKGDEALVPGRAARLAIERELHARREAWDRPGYFYRGAADLLLQHGRYFQGRVLPDEWAQLHGPANQCFGNAWQAAAAHSELTYYEGVYSVGIGHFTTHAWVVGPDDDVVEVTFPTRDLEDKLVLPPEHWAYWGVPFHAELVEFHGSRLGLPMLDRSHFDSMAAAAAGGGHLDMNQTHDFPILKVPYDRDRRSL